ncbi:hypothetical protein SS50377_27712 [Spironucleus salmonicida]|uniref:Uncharacterized protein n=1 Tax=Spironucleus salmonicida TaxID=348837 RepID=V6LPA8_9EUKA|nr:hypothetical protein SS50377_27712 [Spironucleus salmonicida]|eukprot:EST46512.1 hypothetical protein SS50377_13318 [Spironucleus salmonicida]
MTSPQPRKKIVVPPVFEHMEIPISQHVNTRASRNESKLQLIRDSQNSIQKTVRNAPVLPQREQHLTSRNQEPEQPQFEFPEFTSVLSGNISSQNIWFTNLPEIIPCNFISADCQTKYAIVSFTLKTDLGQIFHIQKEVQFRLLHSQKDHELLQINVIDQQLFASEQPVGHQHYVPISSYLQNDTYTNTKALILSQTNENGILQFEKDYRLHVTQFYHQFALGRQVTDLQQVQNLFGFKTNTNSRKPSFNIEAALKQVKSCLKFNLIYIQNEQSLATLSVQIQNIISSFLKKQTFSNLINDALKHLCDSFKETEELYQQVKNIQPQDLVNTLQYKGQSLDRKAKSQQLLYNLLSNIQPIDQVLIQQHIDEISQLVHILEENQNRNECQVLLYWRSIIPLILFVKSGNIYYRILLWQVDCLMLDLKKGENLQDIEHHYCIQKIYLHLMRSFLSRVFFILQDFITYIENEVLCIRKTDVTSDSISYIAENLSGQIDYQLRHLNFSLDSKFYDNTPYKNSTQIVFSFSNELQVEVDDLSQSYNVTSRPTVEQLTQTLRDKLEKIYTIFFTIPLASSKYYAYIDQKMDNALNLKLTDYFPHQNSQNQSIMNHFAYNQNDKLSQYDLLISDDTHYKLATSFYANFGKCAYISISDAQLVSIEILDDKFDQINAVLTFAQSILEDTITSISPHHLYTNFQLNAKLLDIAKQTKQTTQDLNDVLILNNKIDMFENINLIQEYYLNVQNFIEDIINIPDYYYQFMMQIDLTKIKSQLLDYLRQICTQIRIQSTSIYRNMCIFLDKQILFMRQKFDQQIYPGIVQFMQEIINKITELDVKHIFQQIFTLQYDFPLKLIQVCHVTDIYMETLGCPALNFITLVKNSSQVQKKLSDYQQLYSTLLVFIQEWYGKTVGHLTEYFKELIRITMQDIHDARQFPAKFRQNFTLLTQQYQFDPLDMASGAVEGSFSILLQKYRYEEKGFYQSFVEKLHLPLFTRRYSNDVLKSTSAQCPIQHSGIKQDPQLYVKPNSRSVQGFEIQLLLSELYFISSQIYIFYLKVQEWSNFTSHKDQIYPHIDICQLQNAIQPLYIAVSYAYCLNSVIEKREILLNRINGKQLHEILNELTQAIHTCKKFCQNTNQLTTIDKSKKVVFEFTFRSWEDYLIIIEETLLQQSGYINIVYQVQQKCYLDEHYQQIQRYFNINLQEESLTLNMLLLNYEQNKLILDYLILLSNNSQIDYSAVEDIKIIQDVLGKVIFINIINIDDITYPLIYPKSKIQQLSCSQIQIQNILFNIGFLKTQNDISNGITQLPQQLMIFKDQLLQTKYSPSTEQKSRDLEAIILCLQFYIFILEAIPFFLHQLMLIKKNGNLIMSYSKKNSNIKAFSINQLSLTEQNSLDQCEIQWKEIVSAFTVNQQLVLLCGNQQLIKQLQQLYDNIFSIFTRVKKSPYQEYCKQFKQQQFLQFPTSYGKQTTTDMFVIPFINKKLYPMTLFMPRTTQIFYEKFPHKSYYFKYLQASVFRLSPGITDIVVAHSPTRGRIIIGLKSFDEYLPFNIPIVAPQFNYQLADIIQEGMGQSILEILQPNYKIFKDLLTKIIEDTKANNVDLLSEDIQFNEELARELGQFINNNLFQVTYICFSTMLRQYMFDSASSIKIDNIDNLKDIIIFTNNIILLEIFLQIINEYEILLPNKSQFFVQKFNTIVDEYITLFEKLEQEVKFKTKQYLKKQQMTIVEQDQIEQEGDENVCQPEDQPQDLSLTALLGNTQVNFPLLYYEQFSNQIFVSTSNGNCIAKTGTYWLGASSAHNTFEKLQVQQYNIINDMIQGYNQRLPIFLFSSQYRFYNANDISIIVQQYSQFLLRKYINISISESTFARNIKEISAHLISGAIVVIYGSEYLSGTLQMSLVTLCESVRVRRGQLEGILYPYVDTSLSEQQIIEQGAPISLKNASIEDFSDIGSIIFVLPHLISTVQSEVFIHVPKNQQNANIELDLNKVETSQTFCIESSEFLSQNENSQTDNSESQQTARTVKGKFGTNQTQVVSSPSEIANTFIKLFSYKQIISVEYENPSLHFEKLSAVHGRSFFEVAGFLGQLGSLAPKFLLHQLPGILEVTDSNKTVSIASFLLFYLIRQLPAVVFNNKDNAEFTQLIANQISASFGLQKNETQMLVSMAKDAFIFQQSILKELSIQLPSFDKKISFDEFYQKHLRQQMIQSFQSGIQSISCLYSTSLMTATDFQLMRLALRQKKPLMVVCPQILYAKSFFNTVCGILNIKQHWICDSQTLQSLLNGFSFSEDKNQLIIINILSIELFQDLIEYIISFWCPVVFTSSESQYCYRQNDFPKIPQMILLVDHIILKQCLEFPAIQLMTSIFLLLPNTDQISLKQTFIAKQISLDQFSLTEYRENSLFKQFHSKQVQITMTELLKQKYRAKMYYDKINIHKEQLRIMKQYLLETLFSQIIYVVYNLLNQQFSYQNTIEESILHRVMIQSMLYKYGVYDIIKPISINLKKRQEGNGDTIVQSIIETELKVQEELKHFINDNLQGTDLSGLFNKLENNIGIYDRMRLQTQMEYNNLAQPCTYLTDVSFNNEIENYERTQAIRQSSTKANISVYTALAKQRQAISKHSQGIGNLGSQVYTLNFEWLQKYYFDIDSNAESIQTIIQVIVSGVWSSIYNYYLIVVNNGKWDIFDSKKQYFEEKITKMYKNFTNQLDEFQQTFIQNKHLFDNLIYIIGVMCHLDTNSQDIYKQQFQNILSADPNLLFERDFVVSREYCINQIKIQFKKVSEVLPKVESVYNQFQYIWYNKTTNNSLFMDFMLGQGFLSSVTTKTDRQIAEELILSQSIDTYEYQSNYQDSLFQYEKEQFSKLSSVMTDQINNQQKEDYSKVQKPIFDPPIINVPKQISIQRLSKNGVILTIDKHRSAIIQFLSQFMLSPFSILIYGIRNSGKTTLIEICKLVVREIVETQQVFIQDSKSKQELAMVMKSLLQSFNIEDIQSYYDIQYNQKIEYDNRKILKFKQLSYPSFHINMSEALVTGFDQSFPLLLRDHSFDSSSYQQIMGSNFAYNGLLQFQDMSLIVEVKDQPFLYDTPLVKISMPPFKEQFIEDLAQSFWPQETPQWQKQFAKGICLIKSALPTQLVNSFGLFEKMYLTYQYTLHNGIISLAIDQNQDEILYKMSQSLDNELCRGNIHGLFIALRNRSDINQTTMIAVAEKLATLSILKYLGDNKTENPWEDSTLIIKANSQFIPSWEKQILQKSLEFIDDDQKESKHKLLQKQIYQQFKHQQCLHIQTCNTYIAELNIQDEQFLFAFRYTQSNPLLFSRIVKTYSLFGNGIDPIVFSRIFECYLNIQQQKETFVAIINILQKYSSDSSSIVYPTGAKAQDSYNSVFYYLLTLASQQYQKVLHHSNKLYGTNFTIKELDEDDNFEAENTQQDISSSFSGFALADLIGIKVPKCKIIFENVTSKGYSQAVEVFSSLGGYNIVNQNNFSLISDLAHKKDTESDTDTDSINGGSLHESVSSSTSSKVNYSKQPKVLFELNSLFSALDTTNTQKIKHNSKSKDVNIIDELKQSILDHGQVECQDFIALYLICRIAFAYALGINPIYVLPQPGLKSRFDINSTFAQKMPNDVILSGRRQINRVPFQISVADDFQRQIVNMYGSQDEKDIFNVQHQEDDQIDKQEQLVCKFTMEPHQVCIISPKSLMEKLSPENLMLLNYITYSTESQCPMEGLFSNEELSSLAIIVSQSYNLPCLIDRTTIAALLAANLSILIIDDQPFTKEYEYNSVQKVQTIGTCKSPVYEIVKNLHQINNFTLANEYQQEKIQEVTLDINTNHDNKIKQIQEQKITQINIDSQKFIKAQSNMLIFKHIDFLGTYVMSGCYLPNKIDLPTRLQLNWNVTFTQFGISVISIYQWCSLHSKYANISLVQFSKLASNLCNIILQKCQSYVQQINSLFSSFRLFELLAGPSNTTKKHLEMQFFNFDEFQKNINLIAQSEQSANASLQISIAEMAQIRDLLFTIIDASKQSFKLITHFAKSAIFDAVATTAYLVFGISGNITSQICEKAILSGEFADLAEVNYKDQFAQCVCATMKQQSIQISLIKENNDNKRVLALLAKEEEGMLLNNILEFLSMDIPITFVLKLQNISWVPGDFAYKAVYACSLYWKMEINTFIVDQSLAISVALYLELLLQLKTGNTFSYSDTYEDLVQNKYLASENHVINQHYIHCYNYIQIINLELPVKSLQSIICRALESTLSILLFQNFGSNKIDQESKIIINKLLLLKNRKTSQKRSQIVIGALSVVLLQPLHEYQFVFSLVNDASYEEAVKDLKIYIQDFYDKTAIIHAQSVLQKNTQKYILQDLVVQSIFGFDFSLRQQTENRYRTSFLRNICFINFISQLKSYLHVQFCQIPGNKNLLIENIDQAIAQQIISIQSMPQTILNVAQLVSVINNKNNTTILQQFIESAYSSIQQEFIQYQKLLSIQLEDQSIIETLTYHQLVATNGNQIADWIAQAISFVTDIFFEISSYHAPFMAYSNNDFLKTLQQSISSEINDYLNKDVLEIAKKSLGKEQITLKQALIFVIQTDSRQVSGKLSKIILPILLQRIFPLLHIEHCLPYYYLASFSFLIVLGVISNQNSENPLVLAQTSLKDNVSVLFLMTQVLQQNQQTHIDLILYSLLACYIKDLYPSQGPQPIISHFEQIIPQDMLLSQKMSMTWLWILGIAKYSPLITDSVNWINLHHSTIAALSESRLPFQTILKYFINQAGSGNPISASIFKILQNNGTLQLLQNKMDPDITSDQLAQLPFNMDLPTNSILLLLQLLILGQDQTQVVESFDLISTVLNPYLGVTPKDLLKYVQNTKSSQTSVISNLSQLKSLKERLFGCLQIPFSLLFEQCGVFYPQEHVKLDSDLVSESLLSLGDIGQRVFRQLAQYQQIQLNSYSSKGDTAPMPVVFVFYDRNIAAIEILEFLHAIHYSDKELEVITKQKIMNRIPSMTDLSNYATYVQLDQKSNFSQSAKQLTELMVKRKNSIHRGTPMFPVFVFIPSNYFAEQMNCCPEDQINDNQIFLCRQSFGYLVDSVNAHFCYLQNQNQIDRAYAHYFSLAGIVLFNRYSQMANKILNRENNQILNKSQQKPSLQGISHLFLKYAILMSKPNLTVYDFYFISCLNYIINLNISNAQISQNDEENLPSMSVDLSILSQPSIDTNDKILVSFEHQLSNSLRQLSLGNTSNFEAIMRLQFTQTSSYNKSSINTDDSKQQNNICEEYSIEQSDSKCSDLEGSNSRTQEFVDIQRVKSNNQDLTFTDRFVEALIQDSNKDNQIDPDTINIDQLKKSIQNEFFPKYRHVQVKSVQQTSLKKLSNVKKLIDINQVLNLLQSISNTNEDIISNINQDKIPSTLSQSHLAQNIRSAFTQSQIQKIINSHSEQQHEKKDLIQSDLNEMPPALRIYIQSIKQFHNLTFTVHSHYQNPANLINNLIPHYLKQNITEKGIYDQLSFVNRITYWEISALTYYPILGDILNYLLVSQATQLCVPFYKLRLIVTLAPPTSQGIVNSDGSVEILPKTANQKQPFYIKILNFELFGAAYDLEADTICDVTPEIRQGYRPFMPLFASIALVQENDDDYERNLNKLKSGSAANAKKLRIPNGFLAIPLKIGGYVRPFVMLRNRTKFADKEWMLKAPYFGVRFV